MTRNLYIILRLHSQNKVHIPKYFILKKLESVEILIYIRMYIRTIVLILKIDYSSFQYCFSFWYRTYVEAKLAKLL